MPLSDLIKPLTKEEHNRLINEMINRESPIPKAGSFADVVKGGASAMPVIGDAISAYDTYKSLKNRDYIGAALNAIGLLPAIPSLIGSIKNVSKSADDALKVADDYRIAHTSPGPDNAALHNMTMNGVFPDDIYSNKAISYYGTGDKILDQQTIGKINFYRNNPDAMIEVYRAVPINVKGDINPGDWVTINENYAKLHGSSALDGKYRVIKKKVKASEIFNNGDSIHEWGFHP